MRSALVIVTLTLVFTPAARALSPLEVEDTRTTRQQRPFSLAVGATTYLLGAAVGLQGRYQLTDRLSASAHAALASWQSTDVGAGGRYLLLAWPSSGFYLDASAHLRDGRLANLGAQSEIGWEYRGHNGLLFEAGVGCALFRGKETTEVPGVSRSYLDAWPIVSLRLGYAF